MDILLTVADYVIVFGGMLCFLMAVEQLVSPDRKKAGLATSLAFLSNGIILMGIYSIVNGCYNEYPSSLFPMVTSVFLVGPLNLASYNAIVYPELPILNRLKKYIIPAMVILFSEIIFHLQPENWKIEMYRRIFIGGSAPLWALLLPVACVSTLLHLLYMVKKEMSFLSIKRIRKAVIILVAVISSAIIGGVLVLIAFFYNNNILCIMGGTILSMLHIALFLCYKSFPHLFILNRKEIRYENSRLGGVNTDVLHEKLSTLMNDECLYRDYAISLNSMAEKLSVTPHQLSEFLNSKLNTRFANFVNSFRVEDAKKMLLEIDEISITSICFAVGFNSKPTFNIAFKKMVGMNPSEFRDNYLKGENKYVLPLVEKLAISSSSANG